MYCTVYLYDLYLYVLSIIVYIYVHFYHEVFTGHEYKYTKCVYVVWWFVCIVIIMFVLYLCTEGCYYVFTIPPYYTCHWLTLLILSLFYLLCLASIVVTSLNHKMDH